MEQGIETMNPSCNKMAFGTSELTAVLNKGQVFDYRALGIRLLVTHAFQ